MIDLKKAPSWSEVVWYVECPYCGYQLEGQESDWDDGDVVTCSGGLCSCHKEFIVKAGT